MVYLKKKARNLKKRYPGCLDGLGLDLLLRLLHFDVDKRISVNEALKHNYLSSVRDEKLEKLHIPVTFHFEDIPLGTNDLRALILQEVLDYNPEMKENYTNSGALSYLKE